MVICVLKEDIGDKVIFVGLFSSTKYLMSPADVCPILTVKISGQFALTVSTGACPSAPPHLKAPFSLYGWMSALFEYWNTPSIK